MVTLDKIRLSDAKKLRSAGLVTGSLTMIEDEFRTYVNFAQIDVLVASIDEVPAALVKLYHLDRNRCRVHLKVVISAELSDDVYYELMDRITYHALVESGYHKLTVNISSANSFFEDPCIRLGYIQESVLFDEIDNDGLFEDAGLFRILSADYRNYNVCFVPFDIGVAVISGSNSVINGIRLFRFGDRLPGGFILNVAKQLRIVDRSGCLLAPADDIYSMRDEDIKLLPDEVAKAYKQVSDYFGKRSSRFDLNLDLSSGTEFQQRVWEEISRIKYGDTRSYEDIALLISGGDKSKAKNLTRAVGNACSDNPVMLAVPCHRVIGKDGKLAGFSAGVEVQDALLTLEAFSYVTSII
ncbi:MAG: methylated-DNA--[Clostridiales bacterium]|nr:methylated-DNA--[protein]-cysteine S-methyltransferase [Clostridiales bacterium]